MLKANLTSGDRGFLKYMADQESKPTKDSQRALPRNKRMRGVTHQPDSTPRAQSKSGEGRKAIERQAGQRDMFDDPIPEDEIRYVQSFLTGLLHFVSLGRDIITTQRQMLVHIAA